MTACRHFCMWFLTGLFVCPSITLASEDLNLERRPLRVVTYNLLHDGPASGFLNGDTRLEERLDIAIRELRALDPDILAILGESGCAMMNGAKAVESGRALPTIQGRLS
jgi:predicted MPP superfamily phosphohydrolase